MEQQSALETTKGRSEAYGNGRRSELGGGHEQDGIEEELVSSCDKSSDAEVSGVMGSELSGGSNSTTENPPSEKGLGPLSVGDNLHEYDSAADRTRDCVRIERRSYDHRMSSPPFEGHSGVTTNQRLGRVISNSILSDVDTATNESNQYITSQTVQGQGYDAPTLVEDISELEEKDDEEIAVTETLVNDSSVTYQLFSGPKPAVDLSVSFLDSDSDDDIKSIHEKDTYWSQKKALGTKTSKDVKMTLMSPGSTISLKTHYDPRDIEERDMGLYDVGQGGEDYTTTNCHTFSASTSVGSSPNLNHNKGEQSTTFPPGLSPDKNFVVEDWDSSDSETSVGCQSNVPDEVSLGRPSLPIYLDMQNDPAHPEFMLRTSVHISSEWASIQIGAQASNKEKAVIPLHCPSGQKFC